MKYIVGDYCISLELETVPLFSLTVDDKRHFSTYKAEFDFNIVAKDVKQFETLMKKFFEGKYFMQIEKDAVGLDLSFKIVVDEIVMKEFSLQLPLYHKLTEKEEHTARIHQLEEEVAKMRKRLERLELFMEQTVGNPEEEAQICSGLTAPKNATSINYVMGPDMTANSIYVRFHFHKFVEEFEVSNYASTNLSVTGGEVSNIKVVKFTNCQKLTKVDIAKDWWNVKTLIFKGCPDIDFEYLFDGKERCPLKCILLMNKMHRLFERYFTRLQEIGISLRRGS